MSAVSSSTARSAVAAEGGAIRPFRFTASQEALDDLRRRINATKWPERETVIDATQGVQLATTQALARCWGTEYDWRKVEAKLNALPQFITEIDGLDIHFIHVRSKHENALPLIVTHGWPGSITEQLKIIDPRSYGPYCNDRYPNEVRDLAPLFEGEYEAMFAGLGSSSERPASG